MQAIRKIINSDKIKGIIEIPNELKHRMVEISIKPVSEKKSLSGRLSKYQNKAKLDHEKTAWIISVKDETENY